MNIFILDSNPLLCARYHNDKHVVKMILEHTQMMCTVLSTVDGIATPYRPTHRNHPCTRWLRESKENWNFLKELTVHLNDEFKFRSKHKVPRDHGAYTVMMGLPVPKYMNTGLTPFAQAMPDNYKGDDAVAAYRKYYIYTKSHLAAWYKRGTPDWYKPS